MRDAFERPSNRLPVRHTTIKVFVGHFFCGLRTIRYAPCEMHQFRKKTFHAIVQRLLCRHLQRQPRVLHQFVGASLEEDFVDLGICILKVHFAVFNDKCPQVFRRFTSLRKMDEKTQKMSLKSTGAQKHSGFRATWKPLKKSGLYPFNCMFFVVFVTVSLSFP